MCPDDSNGIYNVPNGTFVNSGDTVLPSQHNPWATDSSAAISNRYSKDGRAPLTGNMNVNGFLLRNLGTPTANADAATKQYVDNLTTLTTSHCKLSLSSGNIVLSRYNGRLLTINSVNEIIPSGGVSLAATGLTPSTLYYIYAYMSSGTMTLEASTTAPSTDATTGIQIKSGDSTRSLVGMARPVTGPAWVDTIKQRFVRSWYNRDRPRGASVFTADRSTTSTTLIELNTEIRCEFLVWDDENIQANFSGWGGTSAGGPAIVKLVLDANTADFARCGTALSSSSNLSISGANSTTVGYHYATIYASVSTGSMTIFGTGTSPGLLNITIV